MPGYKNSIKAPEYVEANIVDENRAVVGDIRVTPSSVLWRAKGQHKFLSVPLEKFQQWITDPSTSAKKVSK
jgi:hypothetical protein